jgi:hypothetical protein
MQIYLAGTIHSTIKTMINVHYQLSYLFSWQDLFPRGFICGNGKLRKILAWFMYYLGFFSNKQQTPKLAKLSQSKFNMSRSLELREA